jgi:hypothetical protein
MRIRITMDENTTTEYTLIEEWHNLYQIIYIDYSPEKS